jgi:hypothetical protein
MTFERKLLATVLLAFAACGNYSNEDLEFMNAVPAQGDLVANIPPAPLTTTDEAELSAQTHQAVRNFNGLIDNVLAYIEAVRSYEPTSRARDSRTWGPAAATDEATGLRNGWQWRFVMTRDATADNRFDYRMELQPDGAGDAWTAFITGYFDAAVGVRRGNGQFLVDFTDLRAQGYPFRADDSNLAFVQVVYSTAAFPTSVAVTFAGGDGTTVELTYGAQADGSGALAYTMTGNLIELTAAIETLDVTARWLPSGAGRADQVVRAGDGAGLHRVECWNDSFVEVYSDKPWLPLDRRTTGDPALCPAIAGL